jgi:hypothetical protein
MVLIDDDLQLTCVTPPRPVTVTLRGDATRTVVQIVHDQVPLTWAETIKAFWRYRVEAFLGPYTTRL